MTKTTQYNKNIFTEHTHTALCEINTHSSELYGISVVYVSFDKLPSRDDGIDETLGAPTLHAFVEHDFLQEKIGDVYFSEIIVWH